MKSAARFATAILTFLGVLPRVAETDKQVARRSRPTDLEHELARAPRRSLRDVRDDWRVLWGE